jgi:two-component system cit operon sensor histidine kinase CitA
MMLAAIGIVIAFEVILYDNINSVRVESMKTLALTQAKLIVSNQDLREAVKQQDDGEIRRLMGNYDSPPTIDYISITNTEKVRLYHSEGRGVGQPLIDAEHFDQIRSGSDITLVSEGIEKKLLIKARVPVFLQGEFVGVVSVGINYQQAVSEASDRFEITMLLSVAILAMLMLSSLKFSGYIRSMMHHQSPQEIEMALKLRQGILNSVFEGVVAVDSNDRVMVINDSALKELHIVDGRDKVHGSELKQHLYPTDFFYASNDEEVTDQTIFCNGETLVANRRFMHDAQGNKTGSVISFRIRREKEELEQTINAVIQDKENLRAIIHEFNNQMSVIYGLLQMQKYNKAMEFIQSEHRSKQSDIYNVTKAFRVPTLVALVISKISRAKELGVTLEIDPMSEIYSDELPISENKLTCIVGNLINNAFEAIVRAEPEQRVVRVFIQQGSEFIIEVEDSGSGIAEQDIDNIFKRGVTAKNEPNHGVGLSLIDNIVKTANGTIIVEQSDLGGALFSIYIPTNSDQLTVSAGN